MTESNIIERAFELAPDCQSVIEVRDRLRREGYFHVDAHLGGRLIKLQIRQRLNGSEPCSSGF